MQSLESPRSRTANVGQGVIIKNQTNIEKQNDQNINSNNEDSLSNPLIKFKTKKVEQVNA
jgi:hypothetical protein